MNYTRGDGNGDGNAFVSNTPSISLTPSDLTPETVTSSTYTPYSSTQKYYKMTDAYPETKQSSRGNHPRTSTLGGASAVPTPANNTGGGTGWGDKGFFKGGSQGTGHVAVRLLPHSSSIQPSNFKEVQKRSMNDN